MKAVMQFIDYKVLETRFKLNPAIESEEDLEPTFGFQFKEFEENKALIKVSIELGDIEVSETSMYVFAEIAGIFQIESEEEIDEVLKKELFQVNSVAILYPYLRSLVSDLSSKGSNEGILLPTVNVRQLMSQEIEKQNN
ncbi:protein-export chaperone SecB [Bacillus licheniformis]|jgi:preprotein translocase subunit SecB|uniref:protein-export chaperone SecB n=1 Tax=Bacillus TaxID=1386 RepID=UPI00038E552F|nr:MULTISPECIES: protein-export chaperone SecB [Bacillus]ARC63911.1 preprotein translocase subunit SecB [Bacillus licheniformis]ARC69630.1 preprotein translocase subunit SecB [Bacillus licheniformis]ASV16905.1 hypothetical protein CJO35_17805 [Bacillus sp. 1s-1]EQM26325.1 hypothetical protein N399_19570 [Bacillus licheniformis CG-B52]MBM6849453.1 protein-export chaperone SecB [Bacillus licheniformis]